MQTHAGLKVNIILRTSIVNRPVETDLAQGTHYDIAVISNVMPFMVSDTPSELLNVTLSRLTVDPTSN